MSTDHGCLSPLPCSPTRGYSQAHSQSTHNAMHIIENADPAHKYDPGERVVMRTITDYMARQTAGQSFPYRLNSLSAPRHRRAPSVDACTSPANLMHLSNSSYRQTIIQKRRSCRHVSTTVDNCRARHTRKPACTWTHLILPVHVPKLYFTLSDSIQGSILLGRNSNNSDYTQNLTSLCAMET